MQKTEDPETKLTISGFAFAEPATFEMKSRALAFSAVLDQGDPRPVDEDGKPWVVFVRGSLHISSKRSIGPHLKERWVWSEGKVIDHYLTLALRTTSTTIEIDDERTRDAAKLLASQLAAFIIANTGGEVPS